MKPLNPKITVHRVDFGPVEFQVVGDTASRKRDGLFFTPWPIAWRLAEMAVARISDGSSRPISICDPFMGAGVLLAATAEVVAEQRRQRLALPIEAARADVFKELYGVDVNARMLSLCPETLCGNDKPLLSLFSPNLRCFDSLLQPTLPPNDADELATSATHQASWVDSFPEVFDRGGFDLVITNPPWEKVRVNEREFFSTYQADFSRLSRAERKAIRSRLLKNEAIRDAHAEYDKAVAELKTTAKSQYRTAVSGGDLDKYKLAVERILEVVRPGGIAAFIVPHGILGDWGARAVREHVFRRHQWLEILRLETGKTLFPEIHANLGVVLAIVRKGGPENNRKASSILLSRPATNNNELQKPTYTRIPQQIVETTTRHVMIPLVDCPTDLELAEACLQFPRLEEWPKSLFQPKREVDMTNDRGAFSALGTGIPLLEGKLLKPFDIAVSKRRFDVPPQTAPARNTWRIAWRSVADRAMRRRLIAAWMPDDVALGNSLIFSGIDDPSDVTSLLWILGWMNSRIADAQLRLWCSNNNINIFHILSCRVPMPSDVNDAVVVVGVAAGLTCFRASYGVPGQVAALAEPIVSKKQFVDAIATLDAYWKRVYGLSDAVWQQTVEARTVGVDCWR